MNALLSSALHASAALVLVLLNGVVLVFMLRRMIGRMHLRRGGLHAGPGGVIQTAADVLKLLSKEGTRPGGVNRWVYAIAPMAVFVPSLVAYAALPFSETLRITRLDTGLLFTFAVLSVVPLGVIAGSLASASNRALIGAMRVVARQLACSVPLLLSVLPVVMITGTLDLGDIVNYQTGLWSGAFPRWFAIPLLPSLAIFTTAALCGLDRTVFDIHGIEPGPESGLAGEYSAMRFGLLCISEFGNVFVISALAVTVFFGGWTLPFVPLDLQSSIGPVVFLIKTYTLVFLFLWTRSVLPRVRTDQLMDLGWKWLIPLSIVWIMLVGLVVKASLPGTVV